MVRPASTFDSVDAHLLLTITGRGAGESAATMSICECPDCLLGGAELIAQAFKFIASKKFTFLGPKSAHGGGRIDIFSVGNLMVSFTVLCYS